MNDDHVRTSVVQDSGGPSKTKQSFKDEADVNTVLSKWRKTGVITNARVGTPVYADYSNAQEYHAALNSLNEAQALFDSLPARVRKRVDNDPGAFIAFAENPDNADELRELGLKNPIEPEPVPIPVAITNGGIPPVGEESDPA